MLGLNPGKVVRQIHDDVMTRWIYETNDSKGEILSCENYLVYLNHSPAKIAPGDEIIIRSRTVDNEFNLITCIVGYEPEEECFFPIFMNVVDIHTGKVTILAGLEDYLDDEDEGEEGNVD